MALKLHSYSNKPIFFFLNLTQIKLINYSNSTYLLIKLNFIFKFFVFQLIKFSWILMWIKFKCIINNLAYLLLGMEMIQVESSCVPLNSIRMNMTQFETWLISKLFCSNSTRIKLVNYLIQLNSSFGLTKWTKILIKMNQANSYYWFIRSTHLIHLI